MMDLDLQDQFKSKFSAAGFEDPGLEARALLALATTSTQAEEWLAKRLEGVPLAYLCGKKGFYKAEFLVEPGVLVPRPESEHVVEVALQRSPNFLSFADLGCGTGCIGLSLLKERPQAKLFAVDSSPLACQVTAQNAEALNLDEHVVLVKKPVESWQPLRPLDLIVANPPYIAEGDPSVQASVHQYEPHAALYSGADGLKALRSWTSFAFRFLVRGGIFVTEIGASQGAAVAEIMKSAGFEDVSVTQDLSGKDRVVSACKKK